VRRSGFAALPGRFALALTEDIDGAPSTDLRSISGGSSQCPDFFACEEVQTYARKPGICSFDEPKQGRPSGQFPTGRKFDKKILIEFPTGRKLGKNHIDISKNAII